VDSLVFSLIAKNSAQKLNLLVVNGRETTQPHTWYTCPAGKIAKIKGNFVCTGTGAAATATLAVAGVIIHRWQASSTTANMALVRNTDQYYDNGGVLQNPPVNVIQDVSFALAAGETIVTDQSSGTNAEFNGFLEIAESPN